MKKKIVLIGAGGHAGSCIEVINSQKHFYISELVGIKKNLYIQKKYKVVSEARFIKRKQNKTNILIAFGQLKLANKRKEKYKFYKNKKYTFPVIKSSSCYVSKSVKIGEGTIVMHKCFINTGSTVGKNCIINSGAIIEHDCIIEDNVHIAPGAIILGGSTIGENSFIGSGSVVKQNSNISKNFILPAKKYYKLK
jgi:sugar O-acyltransferase (sialic acid O-acetyltransferase NeuD family)